MAMTTITENTAIENDGGSIPAIPSNVPMRCIAMDINTLTTKIIPAAQNMNFFLLAIYPPYS